MCLKSAKRTSVGIDSASVYSNTYPTHSKKYQKLLLFFCLSSLTFIGLSTTYMASGMELNNPDSTDTLFPCGKCHSPVTYDHKGLQCETCDKWYHAPCQRVGDLQYDYLSNSSCSWHCTKCNSANYSLSTQVLSSFATNNPFSTLSALLTQPLTAVLIRHRHLLLLRKKHLKFLEKLTALSK